MRRAVVPLAALGLLLPACASVDRARPPGPELPPFENARQLDDSTLPSIGAFLAVDHDMREFVRSELAPITDPAARLKRLSSSLIATDGSGIRYVGDLTLTASEVFRERAGNCLSFTALFTALAREAGLSAGFQDMPVLPQWRLAGNAFVVERHVNALVRAGSREFIVDFQPPKAAVHSGARTIDDANATAQYFANLAVARLTAGDLEGAYRLLRRGLESDPRAATLWVNLGVVLARNRQPRHAEQAYRTALVLDPGNLSALNNLALLLQQRGDLAGARRLHGRVERYRRSNPFYLFWRGEQHFHAGALDQALDAFTAATRLLPSEAEFHFALARTHRALGHETRAASSLSAALERAPSAGVRERYEREFVEVTPGR